MLSGIRIVEFEGIGPGPFAGMLLADLGAEVTVIQRPGPAPLGLAPVLDRGKRTIALDLKSDRDRAVVQALLVRADGLIEGYRPGVMERLGFGPDPVRTLNPRLVYGRMTGWGQTGPRASQAGHDLNYIGLSGALWYASMPDTPPFTPPTLVGDIGGGALYLVAGMLAGLIRAGREGRGTVVDAAIVDGSAHMLALVMAMQASGQFHAARGSSLLDGPHWARAYRCACGGHMAVQALEGPFYAEFLSRMGLAGDADFQRQHDARLWPVLAERLSALFAAQPRAHWETVFAGSDACAAPVLSPADSARDAHMTARQVWADGPLRPRAAPRFDGQVPPVPPVPPGRDAHRGEILRELGLD
jgi:alpha-methylacyl-CoA racemase